MAYSTRWIGFTNFATYSVLANASPNPVWNGTTPSALCTFTQHLSAIDALENQAVAYFRLVANSTTSANGGTVATAGTSRVDNFTVSGTPSPVPVPAAVWPLGSGLLGLARLGRRRLLVTSAREVSRTVAAFRKEADRFDVTTQAVSGVAGTNRASVRSRA